MKRTKKKNRDGHYGSNCHPWGDHAIWRRMINSDIFRKTLKGDKLVWVDILKAATQFIGGMLSFILRSFFRYRHGPSSTGFILSFCAGILIIVTNTATMSIAAKPFVLWVAPIVGIIKGWDVCFNAVFIEIHSYPLLILLILYLILATVHIVMILLNRGNEIPNSRGESWIYTAFFARNGTLSEYAVTGWLEPGIAILVGGIFWMLGDGVFSVFVWGMALSVMSQEITDHSYEEDNRTYNI